MPESREGQDADTPAQAPTGAEKYGGRESDHARRPGGQIEVPTGHPAEDNPPGNNARGPFADEDESA